MKRWRVERAGAPSDYIPGWLAIGPDGTSVHVDSWHEAIDHALNHPVTEATA